MKLALRIAGYYLVCVCFWSIWCVPELLSRDHQGFQAAGTIVIAISLLKIGIDRSRVSEAFQAADRRMIIAALDRLEAYRAINEERLNLTFDVHALQISRLSRHLKTPNTFGHETHPQILRLRNSVRARLRNRSRFHRINEDAKFHSIADDFNAMKAEYPLWKKHMFRCELYFLTLGTLQTGYGAIWSKWIDGSGAIDGILGLANKICASLGLV